MEVKLLNQSKRKGEGKEETMYKWVKWGYGGVYGGRKRWWVLTKRRNKLTEYFERDVFGPTRRVQSESAVEYRCYPLDKAGLNEIEEERDNKEEGIDSRRTEDGAPMDFMSDDDARASVISIEDEAQGGGLSDEVLDVTVQAASRLEHGGVPMADRADDEEGGEEGDEDEAARTAFYRDCWASVVQDPST
jgi:hypothetical protein